MLTEEERKYILDEFLRTISHISDKKYQQRVWIQGLGPECDDFDETCCYFFGDGNPILEKYKEYGITESQHKILKKFCDNFEKFSDENNWPQDFINTSEWGLIMEEAKKVLNAFNFRLEDSSSSDQRS